MNLSFVHLGIYLTMSFVVRFVRHAVETRLQGHRRNNQKCGLNFKSIFKLKSNSFIKSEIKTETNVSNYNCLYWRYISQNQSLDQRSHKEMQKIEFNWKYFYQWFLLYHGHYWYFTFCSLCWIMIRLLFKSPIHFKDKCMFFGEALLFVITVTRADLDCFSNVTY